MTKRGFWAVLSAALLLAGCAGGRIKRMEEQQKQILKKLEELELVLAGMNKRLTVRETAAAMSGEAGRASELSVSGLLNDPLTYSGQVVTVKAVLAGPVDKERSFFVAINRPKDVLNNVGVYYDPEDISSKRDVYLSDPGQWLLIEGQLAADKEPNAYKGYSGYALKAKSVRRAP